jgi:alanyl-tRNA synthetase
VHAVERLNARVKELERKPKGGAPEVSIPELVELAAEKDGVLYLVEVKSGLDPNALRNISDTVRQRLGDAVVVLGSEVDGKPHVVATVAPSVVDRGIRADALVKVAGPVMGGGGGGRDTLAQAGGSDPSKLPDAIAAARAEIEKVLG